MLCEYAYYETDSKRAKLCCSNPQKLAEDDLFKKRCPLIYWCTISERFENTADMLRCPYREERK